MQKEEAMTIQHITWVDYLAQKPPKSNWYLLVATRLNHESIVIQGYYSRNSRSFTQGNVLLGERKMNISVTITHWSELPDLP